MHYVGRIEDQPFEAPAELAGLHAGLTRARLIGPVQGSVHTDLAISRLAPGGEVKAHIHSFELAAYVLEGGPALLLDGHPWRLQAGDFALMPIGVAHAWANPGGGDARWLTISTPLRQEPGSGRADTFAVESAPWTPGEAPPINPGQPTSRWVGHYQGTPPQAQALALTDPARGRRPAGADTAILAYSGISVKMLVDRVFGAELLTMFTVDYEPGGAAQIHDHPFEEAYFFLDGEVEGELEGRPYHLRAGDVVWAGVGALHGFFSLGEGRVRWIETQAPQPPARHAYRWADTWRRLEAS
jgi:quercetin dioxygenase-like cupin family protein